METVIISLVQTVGVVAAAAIPAWMQLRPIKKNIEQMMTHLQVDADRKTWETKLIEWRDWSVKDIPDEYRTAIIVQTSYMIDSIIWIVDHSGSFGEISDLEKILNYCDTRWEQSRAMMYPHLCEMFCHLYFTDEYDKRFDEFRNYIIILFKELKNNKVMRFYETAQQFLESTCTNYIFAITQYRKANDE